MIVETQNPSVPYDLAMRLGMRPGADRRLQQMPTAPDVALPEVHIMALDPQLAEYLKPESNLVRFFSGGSSCCRGCRPTMKTREIER